MLRWFRSIF